MQSTPCRTGCRGDCRQGRPPCPHDLAAVEAMREMGVDLRPLPGPRPMPTKRRTVFRWLALALVLLAAAVFSAVFA